MWAASSWRKLQVSLLRTFKRTTGSVLDEFSRRSAQRLFESDITHVQRTNEKPSEFDSTAVCLWFVHRLKESLTPSLWLLLWRIYEQKKINNTLMILLENPHRPFLFKKLEHTCCILWWNVNKQPPNLWTSLLGTDITLQDSEVWLPQTADPPRVCAGPQIPSVPSYIAAAFSFSRSQLRI